MKDNRIYRMFVAVTFVFLAMFFGEACAEVTFVPEGARRGGCLYVESFRDSCESVGYVGNCSVQYFTEQVMRMTDEELASCETLVVMELLELGEYFVREFFNRALAVESVLRPRLIGMLATLYYRASLFYSGSFGVELSDVEPILRFMQEPGENYEVALTVADIAVWNEIVGVAEFAYQMVGKSGSEIEATICAASIAYRFDGVPDKVVTGIFPYVVKNMEVRELYPVAEMFLLKFTGEVVGTGWEYNKMRGHEWWVNWWDTKKEKLVWNADGRFYEIGEP